MQAAEIRQRFLDFYAKRGHEALPSASLVPHGDATLFFVNAGMVPFKDVFTGAETRAYTRATTSQKCMRVSGKHNDLENVGVTPRHHTFFEMLGNFSFGDYFKKEAIAMAWELLTVELGIDPDRLWVTVYENDDEAEAIWRNIGFPAERIQRMGAKDNFWSMGDTGPCGPCSEIHYDHGEYLDPKGGGPATESDRYVEIWNLVFMQYDQSADGSRIPLPRPSIDTGAGLERIAAVLQGVYSNYDTDVFQGLIQRGADLAGTPYGANDDSDTALRVLADHARACAFLIADGVMPSNEGRGYVLRRVMRRAIRFGVKLDINNNFFYQLTDQVVDDFSHAFPELGERRSFIEEVVKAEEARFRRTLDRGMRLLDDAIRDAGANGVIPGERAFELSDTYGFPLDLTQLIAAEHKVTVDEGGYNIAMEAQRARGRRAWVGSGAAGVADLWREIADEHGPSGFLGYDVDQSDAIVLMVLKQENDDITAVDTLEPGDTGIVLLDRTPFYGESGGQVGDVGQLQAGDVTFTVSNTTKAHGLHLHLGTVSGGRVAAGQRIHAQVMSSERDATRRNHTATHLLHAALRNTLGDHVTQKGSLVAPNRLRFDFSHHKAVTADELATIEDAVNGQILANIEAETFDMSLDDAKHMGAMALFGEKYDDRVRVVTVPGFSVELCGGTHVTRTGDIGLFRIQSESGIAAGVRRIEAHTGNGALSYIREQTNLLTQASARLKTSPEQLSDSIEKLQEEKRQLDRELTQARSEIAKAAAGDLASQVIKVGDVSVLITRFDGDLREQADTLRDQLGTAVVVLASSEDGKVKLIAAATKDLTSKIHAGKLIQELAPLVGGRGGGRPDLAQAGGSDASGIDAALAHAETWIQERLA